MLCRMNDRLIIGAMSGTSADGVDAALVRVGGRGLSMTAELIGHVHVPYKSELRSAIFELRSTGKTDLRSLGDLGRQITLAYAESVRGLFSNANVSAGEIAAVAA